MAALCALVLALAGCGGHSDELKLTSNDGKHQLRQDFSQAYVSKTPAGDTDIVLLSQGDYPEPNPDQPLRPLPRATVPWQIVHIRVYWKPLPGIKVDDPTNTNASIRWYFFADWLHPSGFLEYSGSALVNVDMDEGQASIDVQNGWLKVTAKRGEMVDKLGPSHLKGDVDARLNPDQVDTLLTRLKTQTAPMTEAQNPASTQPQRLGIVP